MARRRSLNRRWSRRSINSSAVLDQDSNYIDEEDDTFWRHLPDQTRYSNRPSINAPSEAFLNSNSRIIDDDDIEATEWWNHLQKTSQDLLMSKTTARVGASNTDLANVSSATSHSGVNSITEAIKKRRVMLGAKRKSSGVNPFSQALDLSDIAVESEPILALKSKDNTPNLSRSVEEGIRRSKRSRISMKTNVKYSPDSNTSTDTEKISKARPLLFRRPQRKSSFAFDKILSEDNSIVRPSQSLNVNENESPDYENKVQENEEDTNKTKEYMTEQRSPFNKIRKSFRKSKSNIIIESQEDKDRLEISQNSKIRRSQKSIENFMNDENNEVSKDNEENIDASKKNKGKNFSKQSSDSDKNFKLQLSDRKTSDEDASSPIRSHRSLEKYNSSSSESEIIETRKSKRSSRQTIDSLSDQNSSEPMEINKNANKSKKSYQESLSTDQTFNTPREKSSVVGPENEPYRENVSNKSSSTESLSEVQKSEHESTGTHREKSNSQSSLHQDESADHDREEVEFEYNTGSINMFEKSIPELAAQISESEQLEAEVSEYDDNEKELSLEKKKSISHRKSRRSSKQKMIESLSSNNRNESSFKRQRVSDNKSSDSLEKEVAQKISLAHKDNKHSELEDSQNDNAKNTPKSFKNRRTQLNLSIDKEETGKFQKSLRNEETKETSVNYEQEDKEESDKENDEIEKFQKSFKNTYTQQNSLTDENESERQSKSAGEKKSLTEEIQKSIKQQKLSISRKLFLRNLDDKSSTITELSDTSRDSSRSTKNINPLAYELPNRTRSNSYSDSDADDEHENLVIADEEPMQLMTNNNINLSGPLNYPPTRLSSTLNNQRDELSKKSRLSKINTLDRYLLSSKKKLGPSEDTQLSQEQLQTLGDKLKKIKEKTDEMMEKKVKRVFENTAKSQSYMDTKSKFHNRLESLKNKRKTSNKSVNKAYIVDGVIYKQPKLPRPQKWVTNRLYKFLWKKMEPKYNLDTRRKSEKFVQYLSEVVKVIKRRKNFKSYEEDLNELIKKMAQLGIVETRMEFHHFCTDFLPYAFRVKVNPILMPGNVTNIPFDPDILTVPIINEQ